MTNTRHEYLNFKRKQKISRSRQINHTLALLLLEREISPKSSYRDTIQMAGVVSSVMVITTA